MGNKSRYYDPDFKSEAVHLVLSDVRSIRDVERSLGITPEVLKSWVRCVRSVYMTKKGVALLRKPLMPIQGVSSSLRRSLLACVWSVTF